jgi:phage recombination protein Bet
MTTPATSQTAPLKEASVKSEFELLLAKDSKITTTYTPFGGQESINLSIGLIRRYIATPYVSNGQEWQATDEECTRFLLMCRNRKLDPFTGDAFMVPFWDKRQNRPVWSLITSHAAFLKRAETHVDFDGMESGVIVKTEEGQLVERDGDFLHPGDQLLGGWATVYKKTKAHPKKIKVNLGTYKKGFGVWLNDEAGMICKVAEAQAIRDSFPSQTGDLYLREEMKELPDFIPSSEVAEIKKPQIAAPVELPKPRRDAKGRPTLVEEPLDKPEEKKPEPPQPEPEKAAPTPEPPKPEPEKPVAATPAAPEAEVLELAKAANITPDQFTKYLAADKWFRPGQTKITEISSTKLAALATHWKSNPTAFVKRIAEVLAKAGVDTGNIKQ